ncbi:hypothetical protein DFH08DRAFT_950058 [Mycena albidolilacea]|uniref:Uncharacterized protein n=1 Tax=Mycena albidolilacea TaxID=1033008 RepID=A0AAD7APP3_9AGAR|nr:hypothetical protein DFH08DRAFT_950058 [Mycena albidolilacea]
MLKGKKNQVVNAPKFDITSTLECSKNLESHKKSKDCVEPQLQVLMLDEIVTERRARYDDRTNPVVGVRREHAIKVPLRLDTEGDL